MDRFEYKIYHSGMFAHEAGQTLVAKLRSPARQRVRRRAMILIEEAAVVTELVQAIAGKIILWGRSGAEPS